MKRDDLFPRKYLKAADLKGHSHVLQIKSAPIETLKNEKGEEQKCVLYFERVKKTLPLNLTNYNAVAAIAGTEETDAWPSVKVEIYPTWTMMGGKKTDCIRIRPPSQTPLPTAPTASPPPAAPPSELADDETADQEIPF